MKTALFILCVMAAGVALAQNAPPPPDTLGGTPYPVLQGPPHPPNTLGGTAFPPPDPSDIYGTHRHAPRRSPPLSAFPSPDFYQPPPPPSVETRDKNNNPPR